MGRHLSPPYIQVILVSGYSAWQLSIDHNIVNDIWNKSYMNCGNEIDKTLICNVCAISVSCIPKLARKCEIEHWCTCGAGVQSRDYQIFSDG